MQIVKRILIAAAAASVTLAAVAADISGAGATFPYPIYAKWADAYKKLTGIGLNYQSIGSGGGIKQIKAKTVTFGASDMPLKPDDLKQAGLVQFPMIIGGVVPVVNIKGVAPGQLQLDGATIAGIYLGDIAKWDDPQIKHLNPKLALPSTAIAPVYRSDGSGTNFLFSDYLSKESPKFKSTIGAMAHRHRCEGQRGRREHDHANRRRHRLRRVRLCQTEQNGLYLVDQQGRQDGCAQRGIVPGCRGQCRLGPCGWLLFDLDRPGGRQELANHGRKLYPCL
jgi:ABC-type phosphate transport system substrate-binding protein